MSDSIFHFGFALRFRNKREVTVVHEEAVRRAGAIDASFSLSQPGVLVVMFARSATSQEGVIRDAAEQLLGAVPNAILFEVLPSKVDRMAVRRAMMGFVMPWRFLDQGMPELASGGLANFASCRLSA